MAKQDGDDYVENDSKKVTDHLANERTYLAWLRTGVSTMGLGIVIAKLKYIIGASAGQSVGMVHAADIGLWFAAIGVLTIVMSLIFFLQTQREIRQASYRSKKRFVIILTALTGILGIAVIWYLIQPVSR